MVRLFRASGLARNLGQRLRMVRRQTLPNEGGRARPHSEISAAEGSEVVRGGGGRVPHCPG